jgi:hypothetical protein
MTMGQDFIAARFLAHQKSQLWNPNHEFLTMVTTVSQPAPQLGNLVHQKS